MGQALYRKHRPKSLKDVVGQEHITKTLEQALKSGRISHAYLFTGPKGVGKTSVARILAHAINDLPYGEGDNHIDIIEIDAASNRRIDEIRELRDKVYVAPASAKYKVYIIDEVHMLTREAFNALLKTLEEPPAHVVFILATTDAHKLPETIISRTQRFTFKPVGQANVAKLLKDMAKAENVTISDEALELLAAHGEGSFRDSISLLDQASNYGEKLEVQDIQQLLGLPPAEAVASLATALPSESPAQLVQRLSDLYEQGYQAAAIAKQLAHELRQRLIAGQLGDQRLVTLLIKLLEVPIAHDPNRYLEIVILEATLPAARTVISTEGEKSQAAISTEERSLGKPRDDKLEEVEPPVTEEVVAEVVIADDAPRPAKPKKASSHKLEGDAWTNILNALKGNYNTLYGVVRIAEPRFEDDGSLTLAVAFPFHQKRLNEARNQQVLSTVIEEVMGRPVMVTCIVDKAAKAPTTAAASAVTSLDPALTTISNIFGGGELLE